MNTNRLVRFIAVGVVLLIAISVGGYFLYRKAATSSQNEAKETNAVYQVVGEFGARLRNVPNDTLQYLEDLAAKKGIGVHTVNGVKVFRMNDGRDLPVNPGMDGGDYILDPGESHSLKTYLELELGLPIDGEVPSNVEIDSGQLLPPIPAVDSNLRRFITDHLYQKFIQDTSAIPGRPAEGPFPDNIDIDSLQKIDDTSYTVKGNMNMVTSDASSASVKGITLTVKNINGIWLVDDVVVETFPAQQR